MFAMLRLFLVLMVVLSVIYVVVSIWSRRVRRRKLEDRWDSKDVLTVDRETFIQRGLRKYDNSFRRRLILLIYIIPLTLIMLIVYVTNFM